VQTPSSVFIVDVASPNSLWLYNGSSWIKLSGTTPAPLTVFAIAGKPTTNSIVVIDTYNQLWTYNGTWSQITGGAGEPPSATNTTTWSGYFNNEASTPTSLVIIDNLYNVWIGRGYQ
jgi:hypothetical protein